MDKSEDLCKNNYWTDLRRIIRDDNWPQQNTDTLTQMSNSHWQLRLSHWLSHTAFILAPLAKPNNIEQCKFETNNTQFILGIYYVQGVKTVM